MNVSVELETAPNPRPSERTCLLLAGPLTVNRRWSPTGTPWKRAPSRSRSLHSPHRYKHNRSSVFCCSAVSRPSGERRKASNTMFNLKIPPASGAQTLAFTPCCVTSILTPAILPFQLNRQYISGRHVSLPPHPLTLHRKTPHLHQKTFF